MYRCKSCGHLFEEGEEKVYSEKIGEFGGAPAYQSYSACPICGENYEKVNPCEICGSCNHDADEKYCDECKKEVKTRFSRFVENNFTKEERELLNELYDGERI